MYFSTSAYSQYIKIPDYSIEAGSVVSAGRQTPFWLMSNQYGLITPDKFNAWMRLGLKTNLSATKNIDYDYCLDVVDRQSNSTNKLYLHQAYLRLKLYFVNFQVGSIEEKFGNQDSSLSSGGLLWSGNARPMPKISILVPEYTAVPFTKGYLEFKGGISHGWFGDNQFVKDSWLHHKYLYLQFGGSLPVHVHYGLHHFAQWGGESTDPDIGKMPRGFNDFLNVFFAKHGDENSLTYEQLNALGNHLGSRNFGLDLDFSQIKTGVYWQTIFEDSSGREFRNIRDGLWGIYLRTKNKDHLINKVVYEFINTTDQSGPIDSKEDNTVMWPIGNDDYFNNSLYWFGWTFHELVLGTPLITSPLVIRIPESGYEYIWNNKIICHHFGLEGKHNSLRYKLLATYSLNYGTNVYPFEPVIRQFSFLLQNEIVDKLPWGISASLVVGIDYGRLYGNNMGLRISLSKKGSF